MDFVRFSLLCYTFTTHSTDLLIAGTLDFCDGLGKIAYGLIDQLKDDLDIKYSKSHVCTFYYDPYKLRSHVIKASDSEPTDMFLYTNPIVTLLTNDCYKDAHPQALKIAYTMFEADSIPPAAVDRLNQVFDMLVIPDPFLFEVYKNAGVTRPIFCVPTGLYLEPLLDLPTPFRERLPFTFGCAATHMSRKNLFKVIDAFIERYGNKPDYLLKLQIKYAHEVGITLEEYVQLKGVANIEICSETLSDEEYIEFLRSLDCYILLSTGEGFSNTPREAMAAGIPCILSNNTGHKTLCESGYVTPVACPLAVDAWYEALSCYVGHQFDCAKEDVIAAMEDMVARYDEYFERAQEGREWVARYLWPALKQDFLTLFDPAAVVLADHNGIDPETRTLYTHDQKLFERLQKIIRKRTADVTIATPLAFCDGIGRIGYGIVDVLNDTLSLAVYRPQLANGGYAEYLKTDDPYSVVTRLKTTTHVGRSSVFFFIDSINGFIQESCYTKVSDNVLKIAYSMFESSALPLAAVQRINYYFDMVIVPDSYLVKVYQDAGVTIPVFCVPTGLYLERFFEKPVHTQAGDPFVFGCVAVNGKRKNVKKLIEAFANLYGNNPAFQLKVHTKQRKLAHTLDGSLVQGIERLCGRSDVGSMGSLGDFFKQLPLPEESPHQLVERLGLTNVQLSSAVMTEHEYIDYCATFDCAVSISKGEGFSNIPRESLALGIPCIVSNNTAQRTLCQSGYVIPIESAIEVDAVYENLPGVTGKQYDCTQEAVQEALRFVVDHYQECLVQAHEGRSWVKRYCWSELKDSYHAFLKPTAVQLGAENKIDPVTQSITTTDPKLYAKLSGLLEEISNLS